MKENVIAIGGLLFIAALIGLAVWWQVFKWQECRKVGHSFAYCVFTQGK